MVRQYIAITTPKNLLMTGMYEPREHDYVILRSPHGGRCVLCGRFGPHNTHQIGNAAYHVGLVTAST